MAARTARRFLDDRHETRAMSWVMAVMLLLTVLAAAFGLATVNAATLLDRQLAGRLTIQLVEPDAARRDTLTATLVQRLRTMAEVGRASTVDRARLTEQLQPWLGSDAADPSLPIPALVDVDLTQPDDASLIRVTAAARAVSPAVRVERQARWMSPVAGVMRMAIIGAALLVLLLAVATAAVVLLAVRAGLETHRGTIQILHMLGSTDAQVARQFQRRIALDTLIGGVIGTVAAMAAVLLIGEMLATLGSELVSGLSLSPLDWLALAFLPLLFAGLATLAARVAVLWWLGRAL